MKKQKKDYEFLQNLQEEVPARTIKMPYERLKKILAKIIESFLYAPGGCFLTKDEIMELAEIDEDEWDELMK